MAFKSLPHKNKKPHGDGGIAHGITHGKEGLVATPSRLEDMNLTQHPVFFAVLLLLGNRRAKQLSYDIVSLLK